MDDNEIKSLADSLWGYFKTKYLLPYLSDSVCYFMATVTTAPSGGVIGVQRPFDSEMFLPYAWGAVNLQQGDTCMVLVFGDLSNAIVLGNGAMDEPGIYVTKAGLLQTTGTATDNTMSANAITTELQKLVHQYTYLFEVSTWSPVDDIYYIYRSAFAHGCGTEPIVDVYCRASAQGMTEPVYEKYIGTPSNWVKVQVTSLGFVRVYTDTPFNGKLVIIGAENNA